MPDCSDLDTNGNEDLVNALEKDRQNGLTLKTLIWKLVHLLKPLSAMHVMAVASTKLGSKIFIANLDDGEVVLSYICRG